VNWRSWLFKVIDFCCNRKPIYDFLLVINCHLSSISHRFRDIVLRIRKPLQLTLSPQIMGPPSNFISKLSRQRDKEDIEQHFSENCMHDPNCSRYVTIQSHHRRQTDDNTRGDQKVLQLDFKEECRNANCSSFINILTAKVNAFVEFFCLTVYALKIKFFCLSFPPCFHYRLKSIIVWIADITKMRLQIWKQIIVTGGGLAQLVATLVRSTKLLYARPG